MQMEHATKRTNHTNSVCGDVQDITDLLSHVDATQCIEHDTEVLNHNFLDRDDDDNMDLNSSDGDHTSEVSRTSRPSATSATSVASSHSVSSCATSHNSKNTHGKKKNNKRGSPLRHALEYDCYDASRVLSFFAAGPLRIHGAQTYFPLLDSLLQSHRTPLMGFDFDAAVTTNEQADHTTWRHRFRLQSVLADSFPPANTPSYDPIGKQFTGIVVDTRASATMTSQQQPIFFKLTGILDANTLVRGDYPARTTRPSGGGEYDVRRAVQRREHAHKLHHKLYFPFNTAYVDSLAALLMSRLAEQDVCPHFPIVYGIYNGVAQHYSIEFTEEYHDHKSTPAFQDGLQRQEWSILTKTRDKTAHTRDRLHCSSSPCNVSSSCSDLEEDADDDHEENDGDVDDDGKSEEDGDEKEVVSDGDEKEVVSDGDEKEVVSDGDEKEVVSDGDEKEVVSDGDEKEVVSDGDEKEVVSDGDEKEVVSDGDEVAGTHEIGTTLTGAADGELHNLLTSDAFVDTLHEADADDLMKLSSASSVDNEHYLEMHDVPVQVVAMESYPIVFESALRKDMERTRRWERDAQCYRQGTVEHCAYHWLARWSSRRFEHRWTATMLQVCMGLICAQSQFELIHNDLHTHNIMLQPTNRKHLFYHVSGTYYRVPTYGYIAKIIDMGRATFRFRDQLFMGDVFKHHGEAGEQYSYPHSHWQPRRKVAPNPAFDLARFACSMLDEAYAGRAPPELEDGRRIHTEQRETTSPLYNLLCEWTRDIHGKPIYRFQGFDLYKMIARRMRGTVPLDQLRKPCFRQFRVRWAPYRRRKTVPMVYHIN